LADDRNGIPDRLTGSQEESMARWTTLRTRTFVLGFAAIGVACASAAPPPAAPTPVADARGTLLIVGGGPIPDALLERFVTLAGGPGRARIVIYPMSSEYPDAGLELAGDFRKLGAEAERIVLSRAEADTEGAAKRLDGVTGIWFGGGDQSRLTAALGGTRVEAAIRRRYLEGAVVGGTSAGAAVMSTPMITGDERKPGGDRPPAKDSSDAFMTIAREDVVTTEGFGLIRGAIVDQHFVRRRRSNRLLSVVLEHPELVGIGIDESTALEVGPAGPWRILGASVAVVYDARQAKITPSGETLGATGLKLAVLPAGSTYDIGTGTANLP
jgi:cyanophycinase